MADIQVKVGDDKAPIITVHVNPTPTPSVFNTDGPADDASTAIADTEAEGENVIDSGKKSTEPVTEEAKEDADKVLNGSEAKEDVDEGSDDKQKGPAEGDDNDQKATEENGDSQKEGAQEEPTPRRASVFREVEVEESEEGKTIVAITEPPSDNVNSPPKRTITTVEIETAPVDDTSTLNEGAPSTVEKKTVTVRFDDAAQAPSTPKKPKNRIIDSVRARYPTFFLIWLVGKELQPDVSQKLKAKVGKKPATAEPPQPEPTQPQSTQPESTQSDPSAVQTEQPSEKEDSGETSQTSQSPPPTEKPPTPS